MTPWPSPCFPRQKGEVRLLPQSVPGPFPRTWPPACSDEGCRGVQGAASAEAQAAGNPLLASAVQRAERLPAPPRAWQGASPAAAAPSRMAAGCQGEGEHSPTPARPGGVLPAAPLPLPKLGLPQLLAPRAAALASPPPPPPPPARRGEPRCRQTPASPRPRTPGRRRQGGQASLRSEGATDRLRKESKPLPARLARTPLRGPVCPLPRARAPNPTPCGKAWALSLLIHFEALQPREKPRLSSLQEVTSSDSELERKPCEGCERTPVRHGAGRSSRVSPHSSTRLRSSDGGAHPSVTPVQPSEPREQSLPGPCPAAGVGRGPAASRAPARPFARAVGLCLVPASSIPALHEVKSLFLLKGTAEPGSSLKGGTEPPGSSSIEEGCSGASQEQRGCLGPCAEPNPLLALTPTSPMCAPTRAPTSPQSSAGAGNCFPRRGKAGAQKRRDHRHHDSPAGMDSARNPRAGEELVRARDESSSLAGPRKPLAQLISSLPTQFPFDSAPGAPRGRCEC